MRNFKITIKPRDELPKHISDARSIGAYNIPENPVYIGSEQTANDVYHYFADDDGTYYYESERTMRFEEEMKERQLKRKYRRYSRNHDKKISH